jgi:hypothetical protein
MSDLRKAAAEYEAHVFLHGKRPVSMLKMGSKIDVDKGLIADVTQFHQAVEKVADMARTMSQKASQAYSDAEDRRLAGEREWSDADIGGPASGAPVEYLDTPEGEVVGNTEYFLEQVDKLFSVRDSDGVGRQLQDIADEVESYLKHMRSGRW